MNASLRDLKRRAEELTPPPFSIDDIVERGDVRLGRRRAGLATGTVGLVVAAIILGATYAGPSKRANPPIDHPTTSTTTRTSAATSTRPLTYADVPSEQAPNWKIHSIHYGEQTLRLGEVLHIDVTDDGVALLAEDGAIYFSDGSSIEEIGRTSSGASFSDSGVKAASAGPLLAWFTAAEPDTSVVVYNTHEREVVAQIPFAGAPRACAAW